MHFLSIFASVAPTLHLRQNNRPHYSPVFHCLWPFMFLVSLLSQHGPLDPRLSLDQNRSVDVGLFGLFLVLAPLGLALAIYHHIENLSFYRLLASKSYLVDHHSANCLCNSLHSFPLYHLLRYQSGQVVLEMGYDHTFETYRQVLVHQDLHYSTWPFKQICPYFEVYLSLVMVHCSTSPSMHTFRHFAESVIDSIVFGVDLVLSGHPHCCFALPSEHTFQHVEVKLIFLMYLQHRCYFALPFMHTYQHAKVKLELMSLMYQLDHCYFAQPFVRTYQLAEVKRRISKYL